jgi:hypothetical protein
MKPRARDIIDILEDKLSPEIDKLSFASEALFNGNLKHITSLPDDRATEVLNGLYFILENVCDSYRVAHAKIDKIYQDELKEWKEKAPNAEPSGKDSAGA